MRNHSIYYMCITYKAIWVFVCFVKVMSQYVVEPVLRMRENNRWVYLMHTTDLPILQILLMILEHFLN